MKERPILFSAPMVRALLDGSKTMTRRIMKRQKKYDFTDYTLFGQRGHADDEAERRGGWAQPWVAVEHAPDWPDGKEDQCQCPYATHRGDRLWVRETWCGEVDLDTSQLIYDEDGNTYKCLYRADGNHVVLDDGNGFTKTNKDGSEASPWKPSIHMPRWASRITLEVTGVRVERLQDISEADAIAEGITTVVFRPDTGWPLCNGFMAGPDDGKTCLETSPVVAYRNLWESINGPGSWDANPWVWVIEFKRVFS